MSWFKIDKVSGDPNRHSRYRAWKPDLRLEGRKQCVYCCVREGSFGGYRNFHVEHFRPKSVYIDLTDAYVNLFYACSICNSFKSDAWPGDPNADLSNTAFPDPSQVDYSTFMVTTADGEVVGQNVAAKYTVERLYLNRPQLLIDRRLKGLESRLKGLIERAKREVTGDEEKVALTAILLDVSKLLLSMRDDAPYEPGDITRN